MEARTPLEHGKNTVMLSLLWLIALFSNLLSHKKKKKKKWSAE